MKAKQLLFVLFTFLFLLTTSAQVGVGNTNPQASLDISASSTTSPANNDGILIPRMSAFPAAPGTSRDGMLIFYTGTGASGKGFYYWDQTTTSWVFLKGTDDNDWYEVGTSNAPNDINDNIFTQGDVGIGSISPNAKLHVDGGTTPFRIDRSGNEKLSFRNNALEFHNNGGSIFIGEDAGLNDDLTTKQNIAIGFSALRNNVDQNQNIAIGNNALRVNTGGDDNIAIGDDAMSSSVGGRANVSLGVQTLFFNVSGNNNVAIGSTSLRSNTSSNNNTAVGHRTLYNTTTGGGSIAFGFDAGFTNTTGQNNVYLGNRSGYLNTGSSNVFLGYNSGYNETGNNKLYINNSNDDANNALIYGEFDNDILRTNGELQIGNPTTTGYALPTNQGNSGEVLTSNGDGSTQWTTGVTMADVIVNPNYPDGFENIEPITLDRNTTPTYTVPVGKNFYITNILAAGNNSLTTGATAAVDLFVGGSSNLNEFQTIQNPIIIGAGEVLNLFGSGGSVLNINGFLVDQKVQPITVEGAYTVPANKIFVLLSCNHPTSSNIAIDGVFVYSGFGNYGGPSRQGFTSFINPFFVDEASVVTVSTLMTLNGYLIDK